MSTLKCEYTPERRYVYFAKPQKNREKTGIKQRILINTLMHTFFISKENGRDFFSVSKSSCQVAPERISYEESMIEGLLNNEGTQVVS